MEQAFDPAAREEFLRLRLKPLQEGKSVAEMAPAVARSLMGSSAGEEVFAAWSRACRRCTRNPHMKSIAARGDWKPVLDPSSVKVPTLVVVGDDDRLTPPAMAKSIADAILGARLAIIPAAGHLSNIEQPAAFNAAVLDFLASES